MPSDETTGNLILGAAVVAAAWFISAPLRGASQAAGDVGGFVGDVTTGTTGFVGDVVGGTTDAIADAGSFVGGGTADAISTPGRILGDFGGAVGDATDVAIGGAQDTVDNAVDAATNWKFTGF